MIRKLFKKTVFKGSWEFSPERLSVDLFVKGSEDRKCWKVVVKLFEFGPKDMFCVQISLFDQKNASNRVTFSVPRWNDPHVFSEKRLFFDEIFKVSRLESHVWRHQIGNLKLKKREHLSTFSIKNQGFWQNRWFRDFSRAKWFQNCSKIRQHSSYTRVRIVHTNSK